MSLPGDAEILSRDPAVPTLAWLYKAQDALTAGTNVVRAAALANRTVVAGVELAADRKHDGPEEKCAA